jgi:hypothetical protein
MIAGMVGVNTGVITTGGGAHFMPGMTGGRAGSGPIDVGGPALEQ